MSGASVDRILLTEAEAASAFGVSERKFQELRSAPWMPRPVQLSERVRRYPRAELEAAVANMPRLEASAPMPKELARARIEKAKRNGDLS